MKEQKKITQYDYDKAGEVFDLYIRESDYRLKTDEYIVVHLDGVKFTSKYYKKMTEGYRKTVVGLLVKVAKELCNTFNSIRISYVCSDEISLILDGQEIHSNYHNRINKIISTITSQTTLFLYQELKATKNLDLEELCNNCVFAAKAYNIPKNLVETYLKWRLIGCKKLIFDKNQKIENKEDWEKFGFLITKNSDGEWIDISTDFSDKRIIKQPQNEFYQLVNDKKSKWFTLYSIYQPIVESHYPSGKSAKTPLNEEYVDEKLNV